MTKQPLPETIDWPRNAIFTVGHSTLPLGDFVALLEAYRIECLADIRTVPRSRHNPQFNANTLAAALHPYKIDYLPLNWAAYAIHARIQPTPDGAMTVSAAMPTTCRRRNSPRQSAG